MRCPSCGCCWDDPDIFGPDRYDADELGLDPDDDDDEDDDDEDA